MRQRLAMEVGLWLLTLPLQLRARSLPGLLAGLSCRGANPAPGHLSQRQVVRVVTRVCQLRLFALPIFPRHCLLQSLALYRTCRRFGFPVEIHIGVMKHDGALHAHSWITLAGDIVAESRDPRVFRKIYSHGSPTANCAA